MVVDDDVRMLRMIRRTMELEGYQVVMASNGETAIDVLDEVIPDLVLLDIMMPGMDGYNVCHRIREFSLMPIIMVTAKVDDEAKIKGLDIGADDYITKPFSAGELAARVKAVLRRSGQQDKPAEPVFRSGDLAIDFVQRRVSLDGREVNLTATEYSLLSYLACNADRIVTPDQILGMVWGEDYIGEAHLLQVNMARLRQKLGDDARSPRYIFTKSGIGYMMVKKT